MNGSSTNVIRRIEKHSRYQGKETNLTKSSVIGILDKLGRYFDDKFNEILYQLTKGKRAPIKEDSEKPST